MDRGVGSYNPCGRSQKVGHSSVTLTFTSHKDGLQRDQSIRANKWPFLLVVPGNKSKINTDRTPEGSFVCGEQE